MNDWEYEIICNYIANMSRECNITFNRNNRLMLVTELLEWLEDNGGYILLKTEKKHLKTKDKTINTYMAKWGIKFQIKKDIKYHNIHDVQIKLLTNYTMGAKR